MSTAINPTAPEVVKETTKKKGKAKKPLYEVAEGQKLEATPDDFNPDTHRMTKACFKDVSCYQEHQALMLERRAKALREEAADRRVNPDKYKGGGPNRKAALVNRLAKLEAKLAELGVNVEDLFGDEE